MSLSKVLLFDTLLFCRPQPTAALHTQGQKGALTSYGSSMTFSRPFMKSPSMYTFAFLSGACGAILLSSSSLRKFVVCVWLWVRGQIESRAIIEFELEQQTYRQRWGKREKNRERVKARERRINYLFRDITILSTLEHSFTYCQGSM